MSVVIMVVPTGINFYISYLFAQKALRKFRNKYALLCLILIFSLFLGLNFRMPVLVGSILSNGLELKVIEKQELTSRERIKLISDLNSISYKKNPLETIAIGGNEGCMCFYYKYPKIEKINIKEMLLTHGLSVTQTKESTYSIFVKKTGGSNYVENVSIRVLKNGVTIATAKDKYIKGFWVESEIIESKSNVLKFMLYILQHNLWNYILSVTPYFHTQEDILEKIISNTFEVQVDLNAPQKNILKATPVSGYYKKPEYSIPIGMSGDVVSPNNVLTKITYNVIASTHEETTYPIRPNIPWHKIEKFLSLGKYIYVFETHPQKVIIEVYSLFGEFLTSFDVVLPNVKLMGAPRKPLVYFEKTESGFFFSLLEFGDKTDNKEYMFYISVPIKKSSNKLIQRDFQKVHDFLQRAQKSRPF